jgi:hypothetical protein
MGELRTVSSLFDNLACLVGRRAPRAAQAMMGARWSFGWPVPAAPDDPCEYSFPAGYVAAVARRSGLHIVAHAGAEPIDDRLAAGEQIAVAVDTFHLAYRPAFGEVHAGRTVLVQAARDPGEVWIEDHWQPSYRGPLDRAMLERARRSPVPRDPVREPIFSGRAIDGEWYSASIDDVPLADVRGWSRSVLRELIGEGHAGIDALRRFRAELGAELGAGARDPDRARIASLVLRAELSTRVFLCAWLRAAAGWLGAAGLREAARRYYEALGAMQTARDLLAKSLAHPRAAYRAIVLDRLADALVAEEQLASVLEHHQ